jgi:hypothetical protein
MKCLSKSEYIDFYNNVILDSLESDYVIIAKRDDLFSTVIRIALSKLSESKLTELVNLLNKINNQGIVSIDNRLMTYTTVSKRDITIDSMCSGEKVFLVSFLASVGIIKVVIYESMLELEGKLLKQYVEVFCNADIIVIADTKATCVYLKRLISDV